MINRQDTVWEKTLSIIKTKEFCIHAVEAKPSSPPFSYTIGMSAKGRPELLITGVRTVVARYILN